MTMKPCELCGRGPEACQYCEHATEQDWEAMCDCGLHDFGHHLLGLCDGRDEFKYVIVMDHEAAELRV